MLKPACHLPVNIILIVEILCNILTNSFFVGVSSEIQRNLLKRSQRRVHSVMAIFIELQPLLEETSKRIYQSYG